MNRTDRFEVGFLKRFRLINDFKFGGYIFVRYLGFIVVLPHQCRDMYGFAGLLASFGARGMPRID